MLALLSLFPLLSTDSFNLSPFTEGHTCRQILSRGSYVNKSELAPLWYTGMCLLPGLPAFLMALPCIRRLAAGTPTHEAHALMNVCVCACRGVVATHVMMLQFSYIINASAQVSPHCHCPVWSLNKRWYRTASLRLLFCLCFNSLSLTLIFSALVHLPGWCYSVFLCVTKFNSKTKCVSPSQYFLASLPCLWHSWWKWSNFKNGSQIYCFFFFLFFS